MTDMILTCIVMIVDIEKLREADDIYDGDTLARPKC